MASKRVFSVVLLWLVFPCFAASAQTIAQPQSNEGSEQVAGQAHTLYRQLVERVKGGDITAVDFVQLYSAYSDWQRGERQVIQAPNRDKMVAAFKKKDYKSAVKLAELVLDYEYTNIGLHRATEDAYRKLDDKPKADIHGDVAQKLLDAMLSTGDGKSVQTAYCVMSINDEYRIMRHFGYEVSSQAFITSTASSYDLLSGKNKKTGKEVGLHFDISGFFSNCVKNSKLRQN